jgi:hypothetical protein
MQWRIRENPPFPMEKIGGVWVSSVKQIDAWFDSRIENGAAVEVKKTTVKVKNTFNKKNKLRKR